MNRPSISELLQSKKGSTLITVIILFLFFMIIVTTSAVIANSNIVKAITTNEYEAAYYVAETGLSEASEKIEQFINDTNTNYTANFAQLAQDFLASQGADANGVLISNYGELMGEAALAKISLSVDETSSTHATFTLSSNGILGDSARTVSKTFTFSQTVGQTNTSSTSLDSGSIVSLNPNTGGTPIQINTLERTTIVGPIITNNVLNAQGRITIKSAYVTNQPVSMPDGLILEGVLITSNQVLINAGGGGASLHTIVLKEGGSIYIDLVHNSGLSNVDYVLVPETYRNKLDQIITYKLDNNTNDKYNERAYESILSKVIYYKQENFDPWDMNYYSEASIYPKNNINPLNIFGEKPTDSNNAVDYRTYFTSDFILDNLDNSEIVDNYYPKAELPSVPNTTDANKYNQTGKAIMVVSKWSESSWFELVSSNNEFNYGALIVDSTNYRELDLSQGSQTIYSFESFKIERPLESVNSKTLTINVGNKNVSIVTKSFNINNASLKVLGTGTLTVYVTGNNGIVRPSDFTLSVKEVGLYDSVGGKNLDDPSKLKFVVNEAKNTDGSLYTLKLGDKQDHALTFSIYSKNLNLDISGNFRGTFVSLEGTSIQADNSGGTNVITPLIYAPNAKFVSQKGFTGEVIVKVIDYISGDHPIVYDNPYNGDIVDDLYSFIFPEWQSKETTTGGGNGNSGSGTAHKEIEWGNSKESGGH